jgi:hypothetical protein
MSTTNNSTALQNVTERGVVLPGLLETYDASVSFDGSFEDLGPVATVAAVILQGVQTVTPSSMVGLQRSLVSPVIAVLVIGPGIAIEVVIVGDGTGAAAYATIDSMGGLASITVTSGGTGYTAATAYLAFSGVTDLDNGLAVTLSGGAVTVISTAYGGTIPSNTVSEFVRVASNTGTTLTANFRNWYAAGASIYLAGNGGVWLSLPVQLAYSSVPFIPANHRCRQEEYGEDGGPVYVSAVDDEFGPILTLQPIVGGASNTNVTLSGFGGVLSVLNGTNLFSPGTLVSLSSADGFSFAFVDGGGSNWQAFILYNDGRL